MCPHEKGSGQGSIQGSVALGGEGSMSTEMPRRDAEKEATSLDLQRCLGRRTSSEHLFGASLEHLLGLTD